MRVTDLRFSVGRPRHDVNILDHLGSLTFVRGETPVRFAIVKTTPKEFECEAAILVSEGPVPKPDSIFRFVRRRGENTTAWTTVLVIPTGVGCEIGGHAGDAGPVARLLSEVSDTVVLHPNVVNASDVNEMPENSLYVEGSVLTRFMMGTVGLQPVRGNRVLVVVDAHPDKFFVSSAVNTVSAGRAAYGLSCPEVLCLDPPVVLRAGYSKSGRAGGEVEGLRGLCDALVSRAGQYDALALASVIDVPYEYHQGYFDAQGDMVNPWGGVEAMLTHTMSSLLDMPVAHAPMCETREIAGMDHGVVDPRMAAEAVSQTFLQCVLKGLDKSPRVITDYRDLDHPGVLSARDISCLVIPDGCLGLPVLAALEQQIPVVAVRENRNLMANDLETLPWAPGQFYRVENYWEATGVIAAWRAGIDPRSIRRPLKWSTIGQSTKKDR